VVVCEQAGQGIDWDFLYAHLIVQLHWSWEYIDEYMTFPRLQALADYWGGGALPVVKLEELSEFEEGL